MLITSELTNQSALKALFTCVVYTNIIYKQYHMKALLNSFYLTGHTLGPGFIHRLQSQAYLLQQTVPHESTTEQPLFEWSHTRVSPAAETFKKVTIILYSNNKQYRTKMLLSSVYLNGHHQGFIYRLESQIHFVPQQRLQLFLKGHRGQTSHPTATHKLYEEQLQLLWSSSLEQLTNRVAMG